MEEKILYISRMQAKQLLDHKIRRVQRTVNIHGYIVTINVELSD